MSPQANKFGNALTIPKDIISNRKLIFQLAKNDFKQKFAGSYFGIVWAFVQPVVTVLVYWFVFEKALGAGASTLREGITIPYVLWLIAGLIPWFYFSEVISNGTNTLIDYDYLVKKVVFKISVLPVVRLISSLFVHLFFVVFTLILYSCYRQFPTLYTLQLIYYSAAMMILAAGIIYATAAMVVFFRDLTQMITILLQVLMWMSPIMWNFEADAIARLPLWIHVILKLNPMFYIVCGYRDSLIFHTWFWERPGLTLYFWAVTAFLFLFGTTVFRRLQSQFADVL